MRKYEFVKNVVCIVRPDVPHTGQGYRRWTLNCSNLVQKLVWMLKTSPFERKFFTRFLEHFPFRTTPAFLEPHLPFLCSKTFISEALFLVPVNSRLPKWAGGRSQKSETAGNAAVDDQNWSKIARPNNALFAPLETSGRADGNQKKAFSNWQRLKPASFCS